VRRPRGGDEAGRALALALIDAALVGTFVEVDQEQALTGVLEDLRLLSWSRVSGLY
jgi:hypothetical protein